MSVKNTSYGNYAARRKRACIQAVIPGYIIDAAVEACEKTLKQLLKTATKAIEQVRSDMLKAFTGLTDWINPEDMLASSIGKEFDKLTPKDI